MANGKLKKTISLLDATSIGIGAIVGAGIFVILGVATGLAGPAVIASIIIAGAVALLTALSFVRLSRTTQKEGGAYEFAHKLLPPFWAFLTGFLWLASNVVAGATVALGFSLYLASLVPGLPVAPLAALACLVATALNYSGMKNSVSMNNVLVAAKILVLLFFVLAGFLFFKAGNFSAIGSASLGGVLSGAAIIFFAYGGFARITVVSEEVKNAKRNVPRAIMLALAVSTVLYLLVSIAAVGLGGSSQVSTSGAFLASSISSTGIPYAVLIVSLGALAATASVLLTTVMGVSRVAFAMARNNDAPKAFASVDSESGVPRNAVLAAGIASALLALLGDLALVASVSSFALLAYYAAANYAAIRLKANLRSKIVSVTALISCFALMAFLSQQSLVVGGVTVLCGAAYYAFQKKKNWKKLKTGV
ncbi:MAG: amino acid permease [Candidatus Micrarchaeota archaeon]|nr:amino acid permease [Candidatus Micrarchaeota archaeon]